VDDARTLGYVDVRDNPTHRRSYLIILTARGHDEFRRVHAEEIRILAVIAADIDRADLLTCAAVLERLTSALAGRNAGTG
jgi:DNA-binding MarR family transcriptional regulator